MAQVNEFEKMLAQSDTYLIKLYLAIDKTEQARRFAEIKKDPLRRWQITPVDEQAQMLWDKYSKYEKEMLIHMDTDHAPWYVIDANHQDHARHKAIRYILKTIPFED